MAVSPIQTRFDGGELSERIRGRFDADLYKKGLAFCANFRPTPQGSLLMRAGGRDRGLVVADRAIPFNVSNGEPYTLLLDNLKLRVKDHLGADITFFTNMVKDGTFDAELPPTDPSLTDPHKWSTRDTGFTVSTVWKSGGYVELCDPAGTHERLEQQLAPLLVVGQSYRVLVRARGNVDIRVRVGNAAVVNPIPYNPGSNLDATITPTARWTNYAFDFVAATADSYLQLTSQNPADPSPGVAATAEVDDVFVYQTSAAAASFLASPWTSAQAAEVQYDQDHTKNRMMIVHGNTAPYLVTRNAHGLWELRQAEFTGAPGSWFGENYPSAIEWGFQGRLWLGGTPDDPNTFNGSKSGLPFDFTLGANPDDAISLISSTRGGIKWMQGQKALLMGAERAEQAVHGGGSVVTQSNFQIEDESAFGSAAVQAAHLGDEVVFVGRNRNEIRALSFDATTKNGWVSKAVSFLGEHLVRSVKELHFARSPDPTIIALLDSGDLVACTYDRGEQVAAWWRLPIGSVVSAAVVETTNGAELWCLKPRADGLHAEVIPLHETAVEFLDSWSTAVVPVGGVVAGLARFNGLNVRVVLGGAVIGDYPVVGGSMTITDAEVEGETVTLGLPFTATARLLPRDLKSGKAHSPKIGVLLNDSALPKLNGRRPADRTPATAMDGGEPRRSGKFDVANLGWSDEDVITVEQDLPFRTEILAIYSRTQANEA